MCRDLISNIENISNEEEKNWFAKVINYVSRVLRLKVKTNLEEIKNRLFSKKKIFIFGNPRFEAIYEDIVLGGFGCIHYINKYQKIAMDFIGKYPFSKFLDETQVDYETSLIREYVDLNVLFVGFGKTAQQLFLTSVTNNQFLAKGLADPELK